MIFNKEKTCFVLGADDPEMSFIENILFENNFHYCYANYQENRCHAGNAYLANGTSENLNFFEFIVFIECEIKDITPDYVIDHHRPNDRGYNKPPESYWEGSSVGQLFDFIDIIPTKDARRIAALDHCYYSAIKGGCGDDINPVEIIDLKYKEIAYKNDISLETVQKIISKLKVKIKSSKKILIGDQLVNDLRFLNISRLYSVGYLLSQAALYELDECGLIFVPEKERDKIIISGNVHKETVSCFMSEWSLSNNLESVYGVPERGYAGGYIKK